MNCTICFSALAPSRRLGGRGEGSSRYRRSSWRRNNVNGKNKQMTEQAPLDGFVIEPSQPELDRAADIICGHDLIYRLDEETHNNFQFVQDVLRTTIGEEIRRLKAERLRLDRRHPNQRVALRTNWEIIEKRAQYRKAWYRFPLLTSLLVKSTWQRRQPWWRRALSKLL